MSPIPPPKTSSRCAVSVKSENPIVSAMATSRAFHQRRASLTRYATLSAVISDSMPLEAAHSAANTPTDRRPPLAPLTTSSSVFRRSEAASFGSIRSA